MYDKNLCKYCNSEADLSALVTEKVKIYKEKEREERQRTGCPTTMMISWLTTRTTIWSTRRIRTRVGNPSNVSVVNPFLYNSVSDPHWSQYGTGSSILPQCGCGPRSKEPNQCGSGSGLCSQIFYICALSSVGKRNCHIFLSFC